MVYQPYRSTLQVRFYGLWLEVLRHPQRATGRNHIKRLKMCLGEAGGSTLAHFLARVLLNVEPAGSPARIHEFPEGPLEVSVYFPKSISKPQAWKNTQGNKTKHDRKTIQRHCCCFSQIFFQLVIYSGEVHSFAASLHIGGRL